ncbi:hypothetical protein SISNIDRAFT_496382 [Sistotremastrum niveocremeum HHB9708]|uniref:F-box domain-containing protein n=1 Tax=Sistotremastrum niveocremeum HHB9708 TaxID=1314777 RepID=A0A164SRY3_9AGAM|nr:hypothetical protein SISNIDRAFT_496382 [Sistotremastrum niveocremeum HHB9708]
MSGSQVDSELSRELSELCAGFESRAADSIQRQLTNAASLSEEMLNLENRFSLMKDKIERSMKLKHNFCTPIGRLSDELIREILQYGIDPGCGHSFLTKGFPLFPTYSINSGCGVLNTTLLGESLRQLAPRIRQLQVRWSKVATQHDIPRLEDFLSDHMGHKEFSVLQTLDVMDAFEEDPQRRPIVLNMPALSTMRFKGVPRIIPRPIVSLVHLVIKGGFRLEINEILDFLSYYPQLKTCSITNTECYGDDEDDHELVTLTNLKASSSTFLTLGTFLDERDDDELYEFLGLYLMESNELKISNDEYNIIFSMTYQSRGPISVAHAYGFHDGPPEEIHSFPTLSSYSTNISLLDIRYSILPSLGDIILAFTAWSKIAHIRVCTEELGFERLLTALEDTPTVLCPLLRILDCTGTRFSSLRMKQFLDFREKKGVCIQTLKFTRGFAHCGLDELLSSATTTIVQSDPVEHQVDNSTET